MYSYSHCLLSLSRIHNIIQIQFLKIKVSLVPSGIIKLFLQLQNNVTRNNLTFLVIVS